MHSYIFILQQRRAFVNTRKYFFRAWARYLKYYKGDNGMMFSKDDKRRVMGKGSWVMGALAFVGAAGIFNKGRRLIKSATAKCKEMMHKCED
jgi:hypothetical protein